MFGDKTMVDHLTRAGEFSLLGMGHGFGRWHFEEIPSSYDVNISYISTVL